MAFSHGTADAQKSMGVITMALLQLRGHLQTLTCPGSHGRLCYGHGASGLPPAAGGSSRRSAHDFVKLQPVHGFCVETASAGVILGASAFGMPTSTTHVITSTILGVGLSKRLTAVNWNVAQRILMAWVLTIPASAIVAFITYVTLSPFLGQ